LTRTSLHSDSFVSNELVIKSVSSIIQVACEFELQYDCTANTAGLQKSSVPENDVEWRNNRHKGGKKKVASESARLVSATWRRPEKYRNQITDATLTQRSMQKQLTRVTLK